MDKSECWETDCFLGEFLTCLLHGMMMPVGQLYECSGLCDMPWGFLASSWPFLLSVVQTLGWPECLLPSEDNGKE